MHKYSYNYCSIEDCVMNCHRNTGCVGWAKIDNRCFICDQDRPDSFGFLDSSLQRRFYIFTEYLFQLTGKLLYSVNE